MSARYDVIVIGVGAMGSSACMHLAQRGARVLGLEQFGIPHDLGSSHGESRMIRLCYSEHPDYVPLLRRTYELWAQLQAQTGRDLLHLTGGLYLGRADGELVGGALRAAEVHGLPHELLSHDQVAERFGQFRLPADYVGFYEPDAGFLLPQPVIRAQADVALRHGARLQAHERVTEWRASDSGVTVHTDRGTYEAARLIWCGGAWSAPLLGEIGAPLVVTRQVMGWVWPRRPELFERANFPVWAIENPDSSLHYGFPIVPGGLGLKVAHHVQGEATSPDEIDRGPRPGDEDDFRPALARVLPDADGPLLSMRVCMYTSSPDSHFIIDRHPDHPRVMLAAGFSGHGFKFAAVIGEVLADLTLDGRTDLPVGFLGLRRFGLRPRPV